MSNRHTRKISTLLMLTLVSMIFLPFASAGDTDMDGIDDSVDDCPIAAGNSTIDRVGCPDRDGDGTSDKNDPWSIQNGGYLQDSRQASNSDYYISLFSIDGEYYMTSDGDWLRVWNSTSQQNIRSVQINGLYDVAWSPNGMYIGALDDSDQMTVYYANNISELYQISVDVGSGDQAKELEYSPDSSMIAVVVGRSGNGGTNGEVQIYHSSNGTEITSFTPGGEDRFESVDWSPDGSRIVIGGDEDMWVYETETWTQNRTRNTNRGAINAIAWSPDGHSIVVCEAWASSGARIRMIDYPSMAERWVYSSSTSCNDVEFSPDSTLVAGAHTYYQSDGASIRVFETYATTPTIIDTLASPRPGGCTSSGGGNNCGSIYGVDWHPDGLYIISAHGRNDEGVYHWKVNPDLDSDGVLNQDDAFPTDGTQWDDTDNDGFGDNPAPANEPDACITTWGVSTQDRFGCPDADGDGYSDEDSGWTIAEGADRFPTDGTQWVDTDGDGIGNNNFEGTHYILNSSNLLRLNQTGDSFPNDNTQWNDTDGDGHGDNFVNVSWLTIRPAEWPGDLASAANKIDAFPLDRTQWLDTDGDWIGDNELSDRPDGCPTIWGNSVFDRLGCLDSDGDGWSDPDGNWLARTDCYGADAFPNDATQWCDEDNDGYGSNESGNNADECPNEAGTSTEDRVGCSDRDGDGYSNAGDPFPDDSSQWADRDGDGRGDNPNGSNPDAFPDDTSQWKDTDGDGYGDNPGGFNGDKFSNDATQWHDTDGDGYGDNLEGVNGDVCPLKDGSSTNPVTRGCPDTDLDGFTDPEDAFPEDPFQWADTDGDGYGDNQGVPSGDECIDEAGGSYENNRHGCPDYDFDGWADVDDAFPEDQEQWVDTDGDGWGDNYFYENTTIEDLDYPGILLNIREQRGDAFPEISDQWSDMDGDGWGDNLSSFYQPDTFPLHPSQWNDFDGDGYGDEANYDPDGEGPLPIIASWQPDGCRKEAGTSIGDPSFDLDWGCPDSDNDGIQNSKDPCPWDPEISSGAFGQDCAIKTDPSINSDNLDETALGVDTELLTMMGGVIAFLLALIFVAQIAKAAGKKKLGRQRAEEKLTNDAFAEEEERRQTWIEHYVSQGELDKARELGWNGLALPSQVQDAAIPQWKQHEVDQQTQQDAAIPTMLDLDNLGL